MKNLFLLVMLFLKADGDKFLSEIPLYQKESYFKEKVYAEHDWKTFYQLKEANQVIDPTNYDLHLLNAAIYYATNKVRQDKGLKILAYAAPLRDAAVVHTSQMIEKKFFDHFNNKTRKLHTPEDRMKLFGIGQEALGENIDLYNIPMPSQTTYIQLADKIINEWMHSPPHRKTMLSKAYTRLGCAGMFEASNKDGVRYIKATQDYASGK